MAKGVCKFLADEKRARNINEYRNIIKEHLPVFTHEEVFIPRFNLTLHPWSKWQRIDKRNPLWWHSYNNVKHQRHEHFTDANLKNTLNAIAGLLVAVFYFYKLNTP